MPTAVRKTLTAALTAMLLPLWSSTAQAQSAHATRITLDRNVDIPRNTTSELLRKTLTLSAGEKRHLRGRLETTSSTTGIVGITSRIKCVGPAGAPVGVIAASARNHEGYDASTYATPGHLPIYADLLLTAPVAGVYTCYLYGSAYSTLTGEYHLTAVAGNTWLEVSDADEVGASWWQNPPCESADPNGQCTYVGDGAAAQDAWVFYRDGTPVQKWQAHAAATTVSAQANVELTTCYKGTASCADTMEEYARGRNAVVDLRFEFIQLDGTGHACRTHSTSTRRTVTDDAHHYAAYLRLSDLPVDSKCGTRTFLMRVYVKHVSGQTIKVDGVQKGVTSLTNGIAFNNF